MEEITVTGTQLIFAVATSFAGGLLVIKFLSWLKKSRYKKIAELENEAKYIQELASGYKVLLRSSLLFILFGLTMLSLSFGITLIFDEPLIRLSLGVILILSSTLYMGHIISIIRSREPEKEIKRLQKKQEKIKSKLNEGG